MGRAGLPGCWPRSAGGAGGGRRRSGGALRTALLFWLLMEPPPSRPQPLLPLSLPVDMAVVPQSRRFLPLSQAELGPLFSNSSPFSFSQSLLVVPPRHRAAPASLRASFGPYSVTQLVPEPGLPASRLLSSSLLSEQVERERDAKGGERFRVRVLFHKRGDGRFRRTCVTLHAFKETEERRASCLTQPPLGLCVAALSLPGDWFGTRHANQSNQAVERRHGGVQILRRQHKRHPGYSGNRMRKTALRRHLRVGRTESESPQALRSQQSSAQQQVQLYYSSSSAMADLDLEPQGCVGDRAAPTQQQQQQLVHIKAVTLKKSEARRKESRSAETCPEGEGAEELSLDAGVLIRYHKGLVLTGQPVVVSVNLRGGLSAALVIVRLKMKKNLVSIAAQRSLAPELWDVSLEKSQSSSHEVASVICRRRGIRKHPQSSELLQQAACLTVEALEGSFGVAMAVRVDWWVEYSDQGEPVVPSGAAVGTFSFADRQILGIAPITESDAIINTAVLTNQPVALAATVLAVGHDQTVFDVTSAASCFSADENAVKVARNCSAVYVDGSESGLGSTCAKVEFVLGTLRASVCLEVWAPSVPLRVSLSDPVLNAINGWSRSTEEGCVPVYQRTSVQVLTQFTARDRTGGRTSHLLGSPDWFVDVTELVAQLLRIEDPRVASFGPQKNVVGLQPGKTSLRVVSEQWDGELGACEITVTTAPVSPGDLSVQVVSHLGMSVTASPAHPLVSTVTVTAYNTLYHRRQEASVNAWLQFSDDTASLLSFFSDLPHFLRLSSLAESVVVVPPGQSQLVYAEGDGGGPLLQAELLVFLCNNRQLGPGSANQGEGMAAEATRALAKGSGWVRVNLDLGFLPKTAESREFNVDLSDALAESNAELYVSNADKFRPRNVSGDYKTAKQSNGGNKGPGGDAVDGNHLERAAQTPGKEDAALYFSSGREKKQGRTEDRRPPEEAPDLEVGVGVVLSLLGIFALLFLANCLPSTLRAGAASQQERGEAQPAAREAEGGTATDDEGREPQAGGERGRGC